MAHIYRICFCIFLFLPFLLSAPQGLGLVVSSPEPLYLKDIAETSTTKTTNIPKITDLTIVTNVTNRFAKTLITSKVKNAEATASEATFSVVLPEKAFITGLIMEIDGSNYTAYVEEKQKAKKTYEDAVSRGQTAAHVSASARDSNRFSVNINLEPESKAVFYLTYEELLQRQKDQYEIILNIHPGQPVKNLNVNVLINETRPLTFVRSPSLRSGNEISKNSDHLDPNADIERFDDKTALVKFSPDVLKQKEYAKELGSEEKNGFAGQFVVQYDVERDPRGGEILVDEGYFVHFFAPKDVHSIPKYVVFVLDTSGSMGGIRIRQLKEAMKKILKDLNPTDVYNIVEFNSLVKIWNINEIKVSYQEGECYYCPVSKNVSEENIMPPFYENSPQVNSHAEEVIDKLFADGGTDIKSALEVALKLVHKNKNEKYQPMIVFLTDGEVTVGELDGNKIISNITEQNNNTAAIFALSFGNGADRAFLQKISLNNLGFARHIYEGADAALQLTEFYREISSPLLTNVHFKYVSNVSEVTQVDFPIYFEGTELVVAGRTDSKLEPEMVICFGETGLTNFAPSVEKPVSGLERLWAYLTVKQKLQKREIAENKTQLTNEALDIALKYSFVTDVTSLVVVKPNSTDSVNTEAAAESSWSDDLVQPLYSAFQLKSVPISYDIVDSDDLVQPIAEYDLMPIALTTEIPIIDSFTWLSDLLSENGTISVQNVTYNLAIGKPINITPKCPETPEKTPGICQRLEECTSMKNLVTDVNQFLQYSCKLNEYTGICCPKSTPPLP